jgi:PilZ domain
MSLEDRPHNLHQSETAVPNADRRREERKPATGEVSVRLDYGTRVIRGELVDISPNGFRIRYPGALLKTGIEADITYPWGYVKARIMWVRQTGEICEAGFLVVG